ncbi:MAG TPA: ComEC/Rec2 family competence protein, partial [Candidatus Dormibacteraeota bacterium]|nr:ComEC/Rec2 family competence protein [Candidatus Dormibacteraeota bacterium]
MSACGSADGADRKRRIVLACGALCVAMAIAVELRPPAVVTAALAVASSAATAVAVRLPAIRRSAVLAALILGCAAAGALRGGLAADDLARRGLLAAAMPGPGTVVGVVRDAPVPSRGDSIVVIAVDRTSGDAGATGALAFAVRGRTDLLPGDEVSVSVSRLHAPDDRPGPLSAAALTRQGVDAVAVAPVVTVQARGGPSIARVVAMTRSGIAGEVQAAAPDPQGTFLDALAFGIHQPLPAGVSGPLQDSGLAHLQATSGLKVAVVAGLLARLLSVAAAGPRLRVASTVVALAGYVVLAGGGAAAVRSAVMASAAMGLRRSGRRIGSVPLLGLVAAGMLAVDPLLCRDIGFQMSFLGTLGIILAAGSIAERLPGPRPVVEAAAVTVAAQCATLPIQGAAFGAVSLVGPLANAVAVPLVPPAVALAWIGVVATWISPALGAPVLWAAALLAGVVIDIAGAAASLPGAAIRPGTWPAAWTAAAGLASSAAGGLWLWLCTRPGVGRRADGGDGRAADLAHRASFRPASSGDAEAPASRRRRAALLGGALVAAGAVPALAFAATLPDGRLHVSVLDVGAGPAVLMRTSAGGLALVD